MTPFGPEGVDKGGYTASDKEKAQVRFWERFVFCFFYGPLGQFFEATEAGPLVFPGHQIGKNEFLLSGAPGRPIVHLCALQTGPLSTSALLHPCSPVLVHLY